MFVRNTLTALSLAAAVAVISTPAAAAEDQSLRLGPQQATQASPAVQTTQVSELHDPSLRLAPQQATQASQTVQTTQVSELHDPSLRIVQPAPQSDIGAGTIQTFVANLFSTDPTREQTATTTMNYQEMN